MNDVKVTRVLSMVCESSARGKGNVLTNDISNSIVDIIDDANAHEVVEFITLIEDLDIDLMDKNDVLDFVFKCDEYITDAEEVRLQNAVLTREAINKDGLYNCNEHLSH
tara:strand:- start:212 stop:538 length:327 start_codon:yes stop_codon:yes gene_type:complete